MVTSRAPTEAQRSGFSGERTSSGVSEACRLRRASDTQLARTQPFGEVLFSGEKYPKAAGDTGAEGPVRAKCPRFPGPLSETRPAAVVSKQPPYLIVVACRFGALRAVPPLPEQRYPPRPASSFNSITFLNAAPSLCVLFQSLRQASLSPGEGGCFSGSPPKPSEAGSVGRGAAAK